MTTETETTREAARAASLDDYRLAEEIARHVAVAARHLSRAEQLARSFVPRDAQYLASLWRESAGRAELAFLAEVDEARRRLADDVAGNAAELASWLRLFGSDKLVEVPDARTAVSTDGGTVRPTRPRA